MSSIAEHDECSLLIVAELLLRLAIVCSADFSSSQVGIVHSMLNSQSSLALLLVFS